ncbi:hypothetical protein Ahy_B05g076787 [Arachis hypogaea]|uniref:Lipoxygenase domain-containing protein n=1 Tax=Arachis hypogaea TaxID=3818 RepID=A0A444Z3Y9_ARAHY|nr:hypothetical protein Ahy_B05g076787 [Arachis hypogaea]
MIQDVYYYFYQIFRIKAKVAALEQKKLGIGDGSIGMFSSLIVAAFSGCYAHAGDRFFWFRDEEFARQTVAGLNPLSISLVTEWPLKSELDPDWSDLLEPEDLELNKQMSELGLPLSFHTTKEIDIQSRSAEGEGGKEEYWNGYHSSTPPKIIVARRKNPEILAEQAAKRKRKH